MPFPGGRQLQVGPDVIGDRCTLGVGAFIHYGVSIGNDAVIAPDSFLMKGEEVPAGARWGGNPASEMADEAPSDAPSNAPSKAAGRHRRANGPNGRAADLVGVGAGRHRRANDANGRAADLVGVGQHHGNGTWRQERDGNAN